MGCYLVCHFSGLWASLMSTLIPLRSGAGVYSTLEEGGKKRRENLSHSLRQSPELWIPWSGHIVTSAPQTSSDHTEVTTAFSSHGRVDVFCGEHYIRCQMCTGGMLTGTLIVKHLQSAARIPLDPTAPRISGRWFPTARLWYDTCCRLAFPPYHSHKFITELQQLLGTGADPLKAAAASCFESSPSLEPAEEPSAALKRYTP